MFVLHNSCPLVYVLNDRLAILILPGPFRLNLIQDSRMQSGVRTAMFPWMELTVPSKNKVHSVAIGIHLSLMALA
jgi:hypothetical protein